MTSIVRWREGMPRVIVVGTGNRNKLAELRAVADHYSLLLLSPQEARERFNLGPWPEVSEDDPTYRGNALLKARAFSGWCGCPALGDDSGLEVSALGLGCMRMSAPAAMGHEDESVATIQAALDAGINFLDTGDFYAAGHNEMLIGRALRGRRREDDPAKPT